MKTYKDLMESLYLVLEANLNTRDFLSGMKKEGWTMKRQSGGHDVYGHEHSKRSIVIPRSKTLSPGVFKSESKKREEAINNRRAYESSRTNPR